MSSSKNPPNGLAPIRTAKREEATLRTKIPVEVTGALNSPPSSRAVNSQVRAFDSSGTTTSTLDRSGFGGRLAESEENRNFFLMQAANIIVPERSTTGERPAYGAMVLRTEGPSTPPNADTENPYSAREDMPSAGPSSTDLLAMGSVKTVRGGYEHPLSPAKAKVLQQSRQNTQDDGETAHPVWPLRPRRMSLFDVHYTGDTQSSVSRSPPQPFLGTQSNTNNREHVGASSQSPLRSENRNSSVFSASKRRESNPFPPACGGGSSFTAATESDAIPKATSNDSLPSVAPQSPRTIQNGGASPNIASANHSARASRRSSRDGVPSSLFTHIAGNSVTTNCGRECLTVRASSPHYTPRVVGLQLAHSRPQINTVVSSSRIGAESTSPPLSPAVASNNKINSSQGSRSGALPFYPLGVLNPLVPRRDTAALGRGGSETPKVSAAAKQVLLQNLNTCTCTAKKDELPLRSQETATSRQPFNEGAAESVAELNTTDETFMRDNPHGSFSASPSFSTRRSQRGAGGRSAITNRNRRASLASRGTAPIENGKVEASVVHVPPYGQFPAKNIDGEPAIASSSTVRTIFCSIKMFVALLSAIFLSGSAAVALAIVEQDFEKREKTAFESEIHSLSQRAARGLSTLNYASSESLRRLQLNLKEESAASLSLPSEQNENILSGMIESFDAYIKHTNNSTNHSSQSVSVSYSVEAANWLLSSPLTGGMMDDKSLSESLKAMICPWHPDTSSGAGGARDFTSNSAYPLWLEPYFRHFRDALNTLDISSARSLSRSTSQQVEIVVARSSNDGKNNTFSTPFYSLLQRRNQLVRVVFTDGSAIMCGSPIHREALVVGGEAVERTRGISGTMRITGNSSDFECYTQSPRLTVSVVHNASTASSENRSRWGCPNTSIKGNLSALVGFVNITRTEMGAFAPYAYSSRSFEFNKTADMAVSGSTRTSHTDFDPKDDEKVTAIMRVSTVDRQKRADTALYFGGGRRIMDVVAEPLDSHEGDVRPSRWLFIESASAIGGGFEGKSLIGVASLLTDPAWDLAAIVCEVLGLDSRATSSSSSNFDSVFAFLMDDDGGMIAAVSVPDGEPIALSVIKGFDTTLSANNRSSHLCEQVSSSTTDGEAVACRSHVSDFALSVEPLRSLIKNVPSAFAPFRATRGGSSTQEHSTRTVSHRNEVVISATAVKPIGPRMLSFRSIGSNSSELLQEKDYLAEVWTLVVVAPIRKDAAIAGIDVSRVASIVVPLIVLEVLLLYLIMWLALRPLGKLSSAFSLIISEKMCASSEERFESTSSHLDISPNPNSKCNQSVVCEARSVKGSRFHADVALYSSIFQEYTQLCNALRSLVSLFREDSSSDLFSLPRAMPRENETMDAAGVVGDYRCISIDRGGFDESEGDIDTDTTFASRAPSIVHAQPNSQAIAVGIWSITSYKSESSSGRGGKREDALLFSRMLQHHTVPLGRGAAQRPRPVHPQNNLTAAVAPERCPIQRVRVSVVSLNITQFHVRVSQTVGLAAQDAFPSSPTPLQQLDKASFISFQGFMNEIVSCIESTANEYQGVMDSFLGDRFLISFNAFQFTASHGAKAIDCALAISSKLETLKSGTPSSTTVETSRSPIPYGIGVTGGISSGAAFVGRMVGASAAERSTIIGPVIGSAFVLERLAKKFCSGGASVLLASQEVLVDVESLFEYQYIDAIELPSSWIEKEAEDSAYSSRLSYSYISSTEHRAQNEASEKTRDDKIPPAPAPAPAPAPVAANHSNIPLFDFPTKLSVTIPQVRNRRLIAVIRGRQQQSEHDAEWMYQLEAHESEKRSVVDLNKAFLSTLQSARIPPSANELIIGGPHGSTYFMRQVRDEEQRAEEDPFPLVGNETDANKNETVAAGNDARARTYLTCEAYTIDLIRSLQSGLITVDCQAFNGEKEVARLCLPIPGSRYVNPLTNFYRECMLPTPTVDSPTVAQ